MIPWKIDEKLPDLSYELKIMLKLNFLFLITQFRKIFWLNNWNIFLDNFKEY